MTSPLTLFDSKDHAGRLWQITARPGRIWSDEMNVDFTCWRATGRGKSLNQRAFWGPGGWDLAARWFPRSPSPVPEAILRPVERHLKELVKQQQAQLQQEVRHG
jgi:hypothetical protein